MWNVDKNGRFEVENSSGVVPMVRNRRSNSMACEME